MKRSSYVFTSESVSEGHPDKVCDRISDEVVDLFFAEAVKDGMDATDVRVACETLATTDRVVVAGEVRALMGKHADQFVGNRLLELSRDGGLRPARV